MKILQIIPTAYRATIEEQDDTVLWLTQAMAGAGGEFDVLLCGNAVNYTSKGQSAEGLTFGDWRQTRPPQIARDIAALIGKGVDVFCAAEDAEAIGLTQDEQLDGVRSVARDEYAALITQYDRVWRW